MTMLNLKNKPKQSKGTSTTKTFKYLLPLFIFLPIFFLINYRFIGAYNNLPTYTSNDLEKYNGDDPNKPVYLAFNGFVYDITPGRSIFYNPGMSYHYLAGRDSTSELNVFGGAIIKHKYKIVGIYTP